MTNWKTSLAGAVGGLPQVVNGIVNKDWAQLANGIAIMIVGIFAKDGF